MFKKTLATALLVCAIPALASASWFLTTQALDAGGTITASVNGVSTPLQDSTAGAVFKSYTTSAPVYVTVNPISGYTIKSITINGNAGGLTPSSTGTTTGSYSTKQFDATTPISAGTTIYPTAPDNGTSFLVTLKGAIDSDKSLTALFAAKTLAVTATNSGGSVTPAKVGNIVYGTELKSDLTFTFSPAPGYQINAINNLPDGIFSDCAAYPAAVNQRVKVTFPAKYVFKTSVALSAGTVNPTQSIIAMAPQTVVAGAKNRAGTAPNPVTLTAKLANTDASATYGWTYVSGPANTVRYSQYSSAKAHVSAGPALANFVASNNVLTFDTPATTGQYKFQVQVPTVDSKGKPAFLSSLATVNVVASTQVGGDQCTFCHSANGVGGTKTGDQNIGSNWAASVHAGSTNSICSGCHFGTGTGGHPGTLTKNSVDTKTFLTYTSGVNGGTEGGGLVLGKGALFCASCHNGNYPIPHNTNVTTLGATCAACHTGTDGTTGNGDAHSIKPYAALATVPTTLCINCHGQVTKGGNGSIVTAYTASIHKQGESFNGSGCANCHSGSHDATVHASKLNVNAAFITMTSGVTIVSEGSTTVLAKSVIYCTACHKGSHPIPHPTNLNAGVTCAACHTDPLGQNTGTGDAHSIQAMPKCVDCHAVQQAQVAPGLVNDNSGVRAILGANSEFAKKSHHIFNGVGVAPTDAQCVACHLEGKVVTNYGVSSISVDSSVHMTDARIHLRNAHTDADFTWDPQTAASSDHTNMDNFCMSCHSATGADSSMSVSIQAYLNANPAFAGAPLATATNPFGDLVSNSYDKQSRVNVVDVADQFNTGNYSHHAVKGKRYTTRNSATAVASWKNYSAGGGHSTDTAAQGRPSGSFNSSSQKTLYDGGLLGNNGTAGTKYTPLDTAKAGTTIGDDSQLHCGDCHTVGQWKLGSSTNADGSATTGIIGAHGSANEYMLRNSKGTDALHGLGTFICYNCHNDKANATATGGAGYYAGYFWNNTTKAWMGVTTEGVGHIGVANNASSASYGGSAACIGTTAGLAFTSNTSATHMFVSWASTWTPAPPAMVPISKTNPAPATDMYGNSPYYTQGLLLGAQYISFDANGNFLYAFKYNSATATWTSDGSGNGNTSGLDAQGRPTAATNIMDNDGTVIDPSVYAGTGRLNSATGNILGIGCLNCHNVGRDGTTGGGFGGIHGGSHTYTTGYSADKKGSGTGAKLPVGETQSTYRFMPGLGNYGYAPVGSGVTPGTATISGTTYTVTVPGTKAVGGAAAWEAWNGVGSSGAGGCYTNDYANQNAGWSGCNHHGNGGSATSPANLGKGDGPTHSQTNWNVGRTLNY